MTACSNRRLRFLALTLCYLAIEVGLLLMFGHGAFSAPSFVYQAF